jgi:hypothetical protein
MRDVRELSYEKLASIVEQVRDALYRDDDGVLDPDKPWDGDTFEAVASPIIEAGLRPDLRLVDGRADDQDHGLLHGLDDDDMAGGGTGRQYVFCTPGCRNAYLQRDHPEDHQSYSVTMLAPKAGEQCRGCHLLVAGLPEARFKAGQCPSCGQPMELGDVFCSEAMCEACVEAAENAFPS